MRVSTAERIVVAGHSCVDLVLTLREDPTFAPGSFSDLGPLDVRCGGSVINTGETLATLGLPVDVVTTVGTDEFGGVLKKRLLAIDPAARIDELDTDTSYSLVFERDGESRAIWHHSGSNDDFTGHLIEPEGASLVHLGYATALPGLMRHDLQPFVMLLERIRRAGATVSVDLATVDPRGAGTNEWPTHLARLLPYIDVLSPSADDLVSVGWLTPDPTGSDIADAARRLVAAGVAIAYVTDGPRPAYLCTAGRERSARAGRVVQRLAADWHGAELSVQPRAVRTVLGTNGAGDTSSAGLIHALVSGYTPHDAALAATTLAAERIAGRDFRVVMTP